MDPVARFAKLVAHPEARLDLAEAALTIAAAGDPGTEPGPWLAELDRLAAGVRDLDGLLRRLFVEHRFAGNTADYHDPANSFLHRVLQRRLGIPISLSLVVIEVGWRAGIALEGVGMPGRFLVRRPGSSSYLDPFDGGAVLGPAECEARFRATTGAGADVAFGRHLLPVLGKRQILARMLANLKGIYRARDDLAGLEWVLRMRLTLPDGRDAEAVQLGRTLAAAGRFVEGAEVVERRARTHPRHADMLRVAARSLRARLN